MKFIHVFEKAGNIKPVGEFDSTSDKNTFDSHAWKISKETAKSLENGKIFFHSAKSLRSRFGGNITMISWNEDGRAIIRFESSSDCENIRPPKSWNRNDWKVVDGQ